MSTVLVLILVLVAQTNAENLYPWGAAKCLIPKGRDQTARAARFQQCLSKNYGEGNETRCYPGLGCFPMDYPWRSIMRPFPTVIPPEQIQVKLGCFTRRDPAKKYNITLWRNIDLNHCPFEPGKTTVFIIHGFASNGDFPWIYEMKDAYLEAVDANVFTVDWGGGAQLMNYLRVSSNTRITAAEIVRFIQYLQTNYKLEADDLHIIGHSLGAHISGYVGKHIKGVGRITGLDPAQPGFEALDPRVRLTKEDAKFVEVLHTHATPFIPGLGFGTIMPCGHVDFYINGGMYQPGCQIPQSAPPLTDIRELANYTVENLIAWVGCSHCLAYQYYTQVLRPNCIIWGRLASFAESMLNIGTMGLAEKLVLSNMRECTAETCLPLSLDTPKFPARGVFAATTTMSKPYCENRASVNNKKLEEIVKNEEDPFFNMPVIGGLTKQIFTIPNEFALPSFPWS